MEAMWAALVLWYRSSDSNWQALSVPPMADEQAPVAAMLPAGTEKKLVALLGTAVPG
jgi:hypothetical protein